MSDKIAKVCRKFAAITNSPPKAVKRTWREATHKGRGEMHRFMNITFKKAAAQSSAPSEP